MYGKPQPVKSKRITANLPEELLRKASQATGRGITETLVEGLEHIIRRHALEKASALKGKIRLQRDLGRAHGKLGD